VVLYELLTGQHPFGRAVTATERDEQMQVIPPRVVKQAIPPGLDAICMRALAHDPRQRYGRMQPLIDALVEERFSNGYREGASDLAQAIREISPRSEVGSPRTMHTDRPVTIVTRSLLREITPARRPSSPPASVVPSPTPPSDQFQALPTMAVATKALPALPPSDQFPVEPTMGVMTTARPVERLSEASMPVPMPAPMLAPMPMPMPMLSPMPMPPSGAQTMARMVDQLALAQAAQAAQAAAMFEIPPVLRADGTPMPPFRLSRADMRGDELASVVGGHTATGHAALAIESRGYRWTIGVLGVAALIGVIAAVMIQRTPSRMDQTAPGAPGAISQADEATPNRATETPRVPETQDPAAPAPPGPAAQRTIPPTIPDVPPPVTAEQQAAGAPGTDGSAGDHAAGGGKGGEDQAADAKTADGSASGRTAGNGTASDSTAGIDKTGEAKTGEAKAGDGKAGDGKAGEAKNGEAKDGEAKDGEAKAGEAKDGEAKTGEAKTGEAKNGNSKNGNSKTGKTGKAGDGHGKKVVASKDRDSGSKHKTAAGTLQVDSDPWSWVTVDVETKETPTKFYLSPGPHTVRFYNQENNLTRYEKIVIEPDKVLNLWKTMR
jgi:hypothetical protein